MIYPNHESNRILPETPVNEKKQIPYDFLTWDTLAPNSATVPSPSPSGARTASRCFSGPMWAYLKVSPAS